MTNNRTPIRRIRTRSELVSLASELGVQSDWHEPDEQGVTAETHGVSFDNAGSWADGLSDGEQHEEMYVEVRKDGEPVAAVNLATLFAWATGLEDRGK